jgi:predicted signal transduction protein with EAL and GGDEF domain
MKVELFRANGEQVRQLTASLGISVWGPEDADIHVTLKRADHALYVCKGNGRNQTQIYRPDMLSPEEIKAKEAKEAAEKEEAARKKAEKEAEAKAAH